MTVILEPFLFLPLSIHFITVSVLLWSAENLWMAGINNIGDTLMSNQKMSGPLQSVYVKATGSSLFLPQQVLIKPQSASDAITADVIKRIQAMNPGIPIIHLASVQDGNPTGKTSVERWKQRRDTLVLSHRTTPFLNTFASPGKIVERMGVILNMAWQCPSKCQYCYLQSVLPADRVIYTNLGDLNREVSVEPYVHRAVLVLWTILSFWRKQAQMKVPVNFKEAAEFIRERFVADNISSKNEAVDLFDEILRKRPSPLYWILQGKNPDHRLKVRDLKVGQAVLSEYYDKNFAYFPRINAAEFTDLIALDHLCGHSNVMMEQISRVSDITFTVRTKSAYVDELVRHDGDNRVNVAINFNTPYAIERYEQGTATLDERIHAAQKVQSAQGIRLSVVIEPVIKYPGYEKEYISLVRQVMKSLDPNKIEDIAISCVRYGGKTKSLVQRNHPSTDLFDESQGLLPPEVKKDRWRYPLDERVKMYQLIFAEFRKYTSAYFRIGAETPDAWEGLGYDAAALMQKSVYQYGDKQS